MDTSALQTAWFVIWALFWAVYFLLDASSLGLGTLAPALARDQAERCRIQRSGRVFRYCGVIWLVLAVAAAWVVFPKMCATLGSALQIPLLLLLGVLLLRAVAAELSQRVWPERPRWQAFWSACLFSGSLLSCLLFGLLFAAICQGLPLDGKGVLRGGPATLLTPYAFCGAALFAVMFLQHGLLWLAYKSSGALRQRARLWAGPLWIFLLGLLLLFFMASGIFTGLYANLSASPALLLLPLTALATLCVSRFAGAGSLTAWLASSLFISCFIYFVFSGLYPVLVPSSLNPAFSLTLADAAPDPDLKIMLVAALILIPLLVAGQILAWRFFSNKAKERTLPDQQTPSSC